MQNITIHWNGHACFTVTCGDFTVVLDPYADNYLPGMPPLHVSADLVLCSHNHGDHNAEHVVKPLSGHTNPFSIYSVETYHDEEQGALRGMNKIHILEADSLRIAHIGDLGHLLSPEQIHAIGKLDAVMIPIGGFYTIDPKQAKQVCDSLDVKVVIPMHYKMGEIGLPVVAEVDEFLALVDGPVTHPGSSITIDAQTQPQVAVLSYEP